MNVEEDVSPASGATCRNEFTGHALHRRAFLSALAFVPIALHAPETCARQDEFEQQFWRLWNEMSPAERCAITQILRSKIRARLMREMPQAEAAAVVSSFRPLVG